MIQTICYPAPYPAPRLAVHRLAPEDTAQIAALYRAGGRDGAGCGPDAVRALFAGGAVWWGGFANDVLVLCAACAAPAADTPQAAAMRAALSPGPWCAPKGFLLPLAVSRQGETLAGALFPLLAEKLFSHPGENTLSQQGEGPYLSPGEKRFPLFENKPLSPAAGANGAQGETPTPAALLAALAVKAPAPVLAAYFAAGFAAMRMRPLVSLRPHYLLVRCGAPESGAPERNAPASNAAGLNALARRRPEPNEAGLNAPARRTPEPNAAGSDTPERNAAEQNTPAQEAPAQKPTPRVPGGAKPHDALRRVYLPLADTLTVSRLLEQGFCATALCRSSADERMLICLERGAPDLPFAQS